ncbi:hypothetical protein B0H12DRAFT_1070044 [Mycena haematopus]|nr:hypothetical protein B0H12DRAFT_1070044 [Mycena haematopus]
MSAANEVFEELVVTDFRSSLLNQILPNKHDLGRMRSLLQRCCDSDVFWLGIQDQTIWLGVVGRLRGSLRDGGVISPSPKVTSCSWIVGVEDVTLAERGSLRDAGVVSPSAKVDVTSAERRCLFSNLPVELKNETLQHFTIPELCTLASTSVSIGSDCADYLDRFLTRVFATRELEWQDFRCMLQYTHALISGYFVYHLLFLDSHSHYLSKTRAIDIWVDYSSFGDVVDFLRTVTCYSKASALKIEGTTDSRYLNGMTAVFRRGEDADTCLEIVVHRCAERSPELEVLKGEFSTSFLWMDATGIVVMYPKMTFSSTAIVSHDHFSRIRWGYGETLRRQTTVAQQHGITVGPYHVGGRALCGKTESCPSMVRSTTDAGTFSMNYSFRPTPLPIHASGVSWCLGSIDCVRGREGTTMATIDRALNTVYGYVNATTIEDEPDAVSDDEIWLGMELVYEESAES